MSTEYMVARDGEQFGPYKAEMLLDYLAQGYIAPEDHVWCEGMADWTVVGRIRKRVEREAAEAAAAEAKASTILDTPLAAPTTLDTPRPSSAPAPTILDMPQASVSRGAARATQRDTPGAAITARDVPSGDAEIPELPRALATRYRVVRLLARGGEGFVLLAEGLAGEGQRVIKLYVPTAGSHGPKGAVLDNISAADKAHVVHIYEHGKEGIWYYEVQEYVANGSLRKLMTGPQPLTTVETILRELADALACLHGAKLIHRDLKPENILVRSRFPLDLVLTDFGIASVSEATLHETTRSRTALYSSPEAMTGIVSEKSDWWSIGIILVELLTGRHPLAGIGSQNRLDFWIAQHPIDTEGINETRWRTLCRGLLVRNAAKRWGSNEVRRWLAGETVAVADDPKAREAPAAASEANVSYRPYSISGSNCATPPALAATLLQFWDEGVKHLSRGFILKWIRDEVKDYDLSSHLTDLAESNLTPDARLAALIYRIDPTLPPIWKGRDASYHGILAWANAVQKTGEEREAFYDLWTAGLPVYPHADLQALCFRVSLAIASFGNLWRTGAASVKKTTDSEPVAPEMPSILPRLILALEHPSAREQLQTALRQPPRSGSIAIPAFLSAGAGDAATLVLIAYLREARLADVGTCGACGVETSRICRTCHDKKQIKNKCDFCHATGHICDYCNRVLKKKQEEAHEANQERWRATRERDKRDERARELENLSSKTDKEMANWERNEYGVHSRFICNSLFLAFVASFVLAFLVVPITEQGSNKILKMLSAVLVSSTLISFVAGSIWHALRPPLNRTKALAIALDNVQADLPIQEGFGRARADRWWFFCTAVGLSYAVGLFGFFLAYII